MAEPRTLLILGGTGEARALAERAAALPGLHVVTSLAGATHDPARPAGELRIGGFGGADGLAAFLRDRGIDAVIDATHPYAVRISANTAAACARAAVPWIHVLRPPWHRRDGDRWIEVDTLQEAAAACRGFEGRLFVSVGPKDVTRLAGLADMPVVWRTVDPPAVEPPFRDCILITGRGPFSPEAESALLARYGIGCILSRNSGGDATYAKIAAARALDLPVVMVRRPPAPPGAAVADLDAAMHWLRSRF